MNTFLKKTGASLAIVGLFIISQIPNMVMVLWQREASVVKGWQFLLILIMQVAVIVGFYLLARQKGLLDAGTKYWLSLKTFIIAALGFVAIFVVKLIAGIILTLEGQTSTNNQEALTRIFETSSPLLMFIFIVILAPVTEEIIFRGLIPALFSQRLKALGFGLGALLFGLLHGPNNLGSFVLYVGMGAILAFVCYRYKHLEYTIWIHALNNGFGFLLMLFLK